MRKKITLPELLEDIKDIWRHCLFKSNGKELTLSYLSLNPMQQSYSVLAIGKASCAMTAGAILHNKPEKCSGHHQTRPCSRQVPESAFKHASAGSRPPHSGRIFHTSGIGNTGILQSHRRKFYSVSDLGRIFQPGGTSGGRIRLRDHSSYESATDWKRKIHRIPQSGTQKVFKN